MSLTFRKLHPSFMAEVSPIDLRKATDPETLKQLRAGMDKHAALVFRNQFLTDAEHLSFAKRFDGQLHTKTGISALQKSRLGQEALADVSNLNAEGSVYQANDRKRLYGLGNRLWHTDASFQDPPGRYSMLFARVVPPVSADTQFADTRTAYDRLPQDLKNQLEGLRAHHSIAYSREILGFEFSQKEQDILKGAIHPLVRTLERSHRKALYIAAHASKIIGWSVPEGRLLIRELIEHATQQDFVYTHAWKRGDLVIYDLRATMHRARPYEDTKHRRELRRVTSLDVEHRIEGTEATTV